MLSSWFCTEQQATIAVGVAFGAAAMILHARDRQRWALAALTAAAFALRLFAINMDPFLNQWDECFHALVAKNMITHPFTPMLHRVSELPTDTLWARQHIWLHKPPFFLWQIALSLKVFGLHPWAVRIPSALWWTAMVPMTHRIGTLLVDKRTGFAAAAFCAFAWFPQELIAGALNTDHNDAVFIAAVCGSWWALLEHWRSPSLRWTVATGLFSACAVLTKWHVGLVVFAPWALLIAVRRFPPHELRSLLLAFVPVLLIAGGWILYISLRFPQEAAFQWHYKSLHFTFPMDGHAGTRMYHLDVIGELIPPLTWWLLLPATAWLIWRCASEHRIFLLTTVILVHGFFAFASTKMPCYTLVLFPLYLIAAGHALASLAGLVRHAPLRTAALILTTALLCGLMLDIERTQQRHTLKPPLKGHQEWWALRMASRTPLLTLAAQVAQPARSVMFNVPTLHHIQFTFTSGIESWPGMLDQAEVDRLVKAGYAVYALQGGRSVDQFPDDVEVIADRSAHLP